MFFLWSLTNTILRIINENNRNVLKFYLKEIDCYFLLLDLKKNS